jgi:hypothetical protein
LENNSDPRLGFYRVGEQVYHSKIEACQAGTVNGHHPSWHFNDKVWQSQPWNQEPETDILELYRQRARQIREQYDYVTVFYSGGSDSHTLVQAFIDTNSHIDEIVTIWNRSLDNNYVSSTAYTDAKNIEAEFDFTTRQGLDWIRNVSPGTKITYKDISQDIVGLLEQAHGPSWLSVTREHLNPQNLTRWSATRDRDQKIILDRGKRTAIVVGIDKPRVCIRDGAYYVYFLDVICNIYSQGVNDRVYNNADYVFFYWTPDMPEIVRKQAHMIRAWFEANPVLKPLLAWPSQGWTQRTTYETIVRSIIYPQWQLDTFQVQKSTSNVYNEWDYWFFRNFYATPAFRNWQEGIEHVQKTVDHKYLTYNIDGQFDGFVGMINGHFALQ